MKIISKVMQVPIPWGLLGIIAITAGLIFDGTWAHHLLLIAGGAGVGKGLTK